MGGLDVKPSSNDYSYRSDQAHHCLRDMFREQDSKALNERLKMKDIIHRKKKNIVETREELKVLATNLHEDDFNVQSTSLNPLNPSKWWPKKANFLMP